VRRSGQQHAVPLHGHHVRRGGSAAVVKQQCRVEQAAGGECREARQTSDIEINMGVKYGSEGEIYVGAAPVQSIETLGVS